MTAGVDPANDPVALEPVMPPSRRGAQTVAGVVVLLAVTFVVGYGLGGGGRGGGPDLPSTALVAPTNGSAGPSSQPSSSAAEAAIAPGIVRSDLQQAAAAAATGGAWALCAVDVVPTCESISPAPVARDTIAALTAPPLPSAQLAIIARSWAGHTAVGTTGTHLVLAAGDAPTGNGDSLEVLVVAIDRPGLDQPAFVEPTRIRGAGLYVDLGPLDPSRYAVFLLSLTPVPGPAGNMLDLRFQLAISELDFVAGPTGTDAPPTGQP